MGWDFERVRICKFKEMGNMRFQFLWMCERRWRVGVPFLELGLRLRLGLERVVTLERMVKLGLVACHLASAVDGRSFGTQSFSDCWLLLLLLLYVHGLPFRRHRRHIGLASSHFHTPSSIQYPLQQEKRLPKGPDKQTLTLFSLQTRQPAFVFLCSFLILYSRILGSESFKDRTWKLALGSIVTLPRLRRVNEMEVPPPSRGAAEWT